jgi:hypothetical protein
MILDFNRVGSYTQPGPRLYPRHHKTSGLVQPPVHATAALHVYRLAKDDVYAQAFLEGAYPRLAAWHEYLYRERDPEDEGLVYIRHPWESGMDNSPMWDEILLRIHLKPDEIPGYRRVDTHLVDTEARPVSAAYRSQFANKLELRFSALLTVGSREVRCERVAVS